MRTECKRKNDRSIPIGVCAASTGACISAACRKLASRCRAALVLFCMKIVATNQAATNVDATQILQDRAARLQGEGARPRKLQEADATADRALKALEALPGSRYDAAATAAAALAGADLGLTRNERLAVLNVAPTNAAVVGAVVDNDTREPRLDDAQVAKVCAVAKELRA